MGRVKIGLIGCGAIGQMQHLPNLLDLRDQFEVKVVCDISAKAAEYCAAKYSVPEYVTDYRDLLASDIDAVLHCAGDKVEHALATFDAGKHLFIEKPVCSSVEEVDAMLAAQKRAGKVGQVGYMKIFDPAFVYAEKQVRQMENIRYVQVNHFHCDNALHVRQFDIRCFDDLPPRDMKAMQAERAASLAQILGVDEVPPEAASAFGTLSGSMIHDIYGMRVLLGMPSKILSCEIWTGERPVDRGITFTLEYPAGFRLVGTWLEQYELWSFQETLGIYGNDKRVVVSYPRALLPGASPR